ncbi:MAG TPA: inorganic diphosphatase [Solirubrobacteraceae bacterium]|nr:inorganic diphosphatase [Solirubrobacteraceae bacterium]
MSERELTGPAERRSSPDRHHEHDQYTLTCVVEIPRGSRNKYEFDPALDAIRLDRFISAAVVYPTDYGFVPETIAPDGDPLDVLVCVSEPTFPGCFVITRPVALLCFADEKGPDDHLVCVPCADPSWTGVRDLDDIPEQLKAEIGHFFSIYKDLDPTRNSTVSGWRDRGAAWDAVGSARATWEAHQRD